MAIDVIKDIELYDQRIYWNGYHPEDMPYLMININLHYNLLKVHRFIRTHGLFSVNEQIICGSLSIYFDILPHIVSKKHFIIKSAFLNKILNNKICNLIIMYNITTMIFTI